MAAIANITVFDGATTPVSHTLTAIAVSRSTSGDVSAEWREVLASVPRYAQVYATMKMATLKSGVTRAELTVGVPVMEAITNQNAAGYTAAPKVAYEDKYTLTGYQHPRSTLTSRRLARQMIINLAGNISTTVAPATTGPAPDLFDSQVLPT